MRIITASLAIVTAVFVAAGCGSDSSSDSGGDRTKVVAAFYPLAWVAEEVGGNDVDVENLTPPGVEPHDLELAPRDVAKIEGADVILYLGHGFQPAVEDAINNSDAKKIDVLDIEGLDLHDPVEGDSHDHGHDDESEEDRADEKAHEEDAHEGEGEVDVDPHVWLDPTRLAKIAKHVADELDADATDVQDKLNKLDGEFEAGLKTCERREMFTSHAAFGYLADRYDLEQVAISGISPDAEPLPQDLKKVAEEAKEHEATTIYFESLVSPKLSEQVAETVGAKTAVLDPIEGIDQDRLDEGVEFEDVMRENLEALRSGLDCS